MKSHTLANALLALPDQFVYIHPTTPEKAYEVSHILQRLNGLILMPAQPDNQKKGGQK